MGFLACVKIFNKISNDDNEHGIVKAKARQTTQLTRVALQFTMLAHKVHLYESRIFGGFVNLGQDS